MSTFNTLRAANAARQKEWDKAGGIDAAYRANELAGETGEACNVIKKLERERLGIRGSRDNVEHLGDELADVMICVDLIAIGHKAKLPLDSGFPVGFTTAAHGGAQLAKHVGQLCDIIITDGDVAYPLDIQFAFLRVVRTAYGIAHMYGIDLDAAIAAKFNATSAKVGLRTRLVSHVSLSVKAGV
jgi:NTP pyrophosphatase (non-canonical NTP hydrolase)